MSQHQDPVVIVSAARTPMGGFMSDFADLAAHDLGGVAIKAAVERAGIAPALVEEVLFGNCLMAGQGQAPARQALFKGGLPQSTGAVTLSKMCGAGMEATILAHDQLIAGSREVMVSGGMESMSGAPYLLKKGRGGYRMGHDKVFDHMMLDGLEDAYEPGRSMGTFGEDCAAKYQFTREQQDAFAIASVTRAQEAARSGAFDAEIAPVTLKTRKGEVTVSVDEGPAKARLDKIASLKPDLILDVKSSGDQARYDRLKSIAPTVGVPEGGDSWLANPEQQTTMIATALGVKEQAATLLKEVDDAFAAAARALPG